MYRIPEHDHNLSMRLSEVLDDIGVNEGMVSMRRRSALLMETSYSLLSGTFSNIFGSKSEGTTTLGLKSDIDVLISNPYCNVIQDFAEWQPGVFNLLMTQDDETSPGYCYLQLIRPDMPLPVTDILDKDCYQDVHRRILIKNTAFDYINTNYTRNGPAWTSKGQSGLCSTDFVNSVSCESWPKEARDWSQRCFGKWPTEDMKRYVENSGCFVVPVGSKVCPPDQQVLEWRISTSRAERCLMYNLNITQIRCFVLLKMIKKTYLRQSISSYMCKTVLLRCIEKMPYNMWQENNLLKCLTVCLQALHNCILHKNCPHYFIPKNNLMARKFSTQMKDKLQKSLQNILEDQAAALYGIQIDDLGERLEIKMNPLYRSQDAQLLSSHDISRNISSTSIINVVRTARSWMFQISPRKGKHLRNAVTVSKKLVHHILNILKLYKKGINTERKALQVLVPLYCSSLGSVLASVNIGTNHSVSPEALNWLSAGLNSDVSSGRLKLASVLYCAGDMLWAESILKETERLYRLDSVLHVCGCYYFERQGMTRECSRIYDIQIEKVISNICAFCVGFFQAEMNCIPHELQYELFRSTEEEKLHRINTDSWMDMAVVDSLPFLYFLQYKIYGNLQRYNDQQRALENLTLTVILNEDFGHRETTNNLLGQCMEQENRLDEALACYITSLNIRGANNVARFHLCRLLADMQNYVHSD